MIEGTETPKLPSKFAKCVARYKEFGSKYAFLGHFTFKQAQPLPSPHKQSCMCMYPEVFQSFNYI